VHGIRDRFGVISPGGDQVRTPRQSPVFLAGTLAGESVEMSLRSTLDGRLVGIMSDPSGVVLSIAGTFDPATGMLTLRQSAGGDVDTGILVAQTSGGLEFRGTLTRAAGPLPLTLVQDPLVGQWLGQNPVQRLQVIRAPGGMAGYVGGWMGDELPREWRPMRVTPGVNTYTLDFDPGRIVVNIAGPRMSGQLGGAILPAAQAWTATRRTDAFGLIK